MKALLLALKAKKGAPSKSMPPGDDDEEGAPEPAEGDDYKQIMKDAAHDGDWDAFVDALCSYVGK